MYILILYQKNVDKLQAPIFNKFFFPFFLIPDYNKSLLTLCVLSLIVQMVLSMPTIDENRNRKAAQQRKSKLKSLHGPNPFTLDENLWRNPCNVEGNYVKDREDVNSMKKIRDNMSSAIQDVLNKLESIETVVPNGSTLQKNYTNLPNIKNVSFNSFEQNNNFFNLNTIP